MNNESDHLPAPKDPLLIEHEADGIRELDNLLPRWWVWIFYATIVFAAVYALDPRGTIRGPGRIKEYQAQLADAARRWPQGSGGIDEATLVAASKDASTVAAGRAVFATNCTPCHGPDGGGIIGPNLTDQYWLHGNTLPEIYKTVSEGVLTKGMPNWGKLLKPEQVKAVVVYVKSLEGTTPKTPKAPQGVLVPAK